MHKGFLTLTSKKLIMSNTIFRLHPTVQCDMTGWVCVDPIEIKETKSVYLGNNSRLVSSYGYRK